MATATMNPTIETEETKADPVVGENREFRQLVRAKRAEVRAAKARAHELKDAAASAKKRWEALRDELEDLVDEFESPRPLFRKPDVEASATPESSAPDDPPATAPVPVEDWKTVPLTTVPGLTPGILGKLEECTISGRPVKTIGELQELESLLSSRGMDLTQVPGIGTAAMDKIADALAEFWKANPQPADPPEGAAEGEAEDGQDGPPDAIVEGDDALLLTALNVGELPERWERLAAKGVSDHELVGHLAHAFNLPDHNEQKSYIVRGGKRPFFATLDGTGAEGKAVGGEELIAKARRLLDLPDAKAAASA